MAECRKLTVGFAMTGSFCTFEKIRKVMKSMSEMNMKIVPVLSYNVQTMDSRFGKACEFRKSVESIAGCRAVCSIQEAETFGPGAKLDVLVIAPCTGNTLAKLAAGITDTPVLMAAKAHLRNDRPLVISISTNDALGMNFKNIGLLMNVKNIYFVPFGQDNCIKKHNSMTACVDLIPDSIIQAMEGKQIQPVLRSPL